MLRFLLSFETGWKAAQAVLTEHEGRAEGSPKGVIRACREIGLLTEADATRALIMADDRNLVSHAYDEPLARAIDRRLAGHAALLERWLGALRARIGGGRAAPAGAVARRRRGGSARRKRG